MAKRAAVAFASAAPGNPVSQIAGADPSAARNAELAAGVATSQLQNATTAPDRLALAQQAFSTLTASGVPQYQQDLRTVGQSAARLGRIGAGMTTNELTGVELARQRTLDEAAQNLSTEAAGKTLDDRLALAQAGLGQYQAFQGAGQNAADLALQTELGRGNLELGQGRLGLDTSNAAAAQKLAIAQQAIDKANAEAQLGLEGRSIDNTYGLSQAQLAEQKRQYDANLDFNNVQADRNFAINPAVADAEAALAGYNLTGDATTPGVAGNNALSLPSVGGASVAPITSPQPVLTGSNGPATPQRIQAAKALQTLIQSKPNTGDTNAMFRWMQRVEQAQQAYEAQGGDPSTVKQDAMAATGGV